MNGSPCCATRYGTQCGTQHGTQFGTSETTATAHTPTAVSSAADPGSAEEMLSRRGAQFKHARQLHDEHRVPLRAGCADGSDFGLSPVP